MNQLLVLWLSAGVFFFIMEMFTGTLYGLSLSLAAFLLAAYVGITGEQTFTLVQASILAVSSAGFSYVFPKWFSRNESSEGGFSNQILDREIGNIFALKRASENTYKISIDGVDYFVADACVTPAFE
jgi:membrane protein implicated in regulation of membrane protease activity